MARSRAHPLAELQHDTAGRGAWVAGCRWCVEGLGSPVVDRGAMVTMARQSLASVATDFDTDEVLTFWQSHDQAIHAGPP